LGLIEPIRNEGPIVELVDGAQPVCKVFQEKPGSVPGTQSLRTTSDSGKDVAVAKSTSRDGRSTRSYAANA